MNNYQANQIDLNSFEAEVLRGIEVLERGPRVVIRHRHEMKKLALFDNLNKTTHKMELEWQEEYLKLRMLINRKKVINDQIIDLIQGPFSFLKAGRIRKLTSELESIDTQIAEITHRLSDRLSELPRLSLIRVKEGLDEVQEELEIIVKEADEFRIVQEQKRVEATKALLNDNLRKRICAALRSITGDAHEIAKAITPVIVPLILTGVLNIPLQPIIISHISILIARMGVSAICGEKEEKRKED